MKHRIKIKICGMTRLQDVRAAVDLGVDAIGVILHADSPRLIDEKLACEIRSLIPAFISFVGVFVNADALLINRYSRRIGLDLVQLHGGESDDFGRSLDIAFIKAIRARNAEQVRQDVAAFPGASALLLDPYVKGQPGGTGSKLDLALWPSNSADAELSKPGAEFVKPAQRLILAGGLSPENVAATAAQTMPYAVDLNSGVETQPGVKDPALIDAAMRALGR